jgi:cytochrome b
MLMFLMILETATAVMFHETMVMALMVTMVIHVMAMMVTTVFHVMAMMVTTMFHVMTTMTFVVSMMMFF